jgi:hypothetical protein
LRPSNARSSTRTNQGERRWTRRPHPAPQKALPASNLQAGPRKPPLQSPRRWSPGQRARHGVGSRRRRCRCRERTRLCWGHRCERPRE